MSNTMTIAEQQLHVATNGKIFHKILDGEKYTYNIYACTECPGNHHTYCNNLNNKRDFNMCDVSDMKTHKFPRTCPLVTIGEDNVK